MHAGLMHCICILLFDDEPLRCRIRLTVAIIDSAVDLSESASPVYAGWSSGLVSLWLTLPHQWGRNGYVPSGL